MQFLRSEFLWKWIFFSWIPNPSGKEATKDSVFLLKDDFLA